jgi:hypothetical protein
MHGLSVQNAGKITKRGLQGVRADYRHSPVRFERPGEWAYCFKYIKSLKDFFAGEFGKAGEVRRLHSFWIVRCINITNSHS